MRLRIDIDLSNAAFEDARTLETVRVLARVVALITKTGVGAPGEWNLMDSNGNRCGAVCVEGE